MSSHKHCDYCHKDMSKEKDVDQVYDLGSGRAFIEDVKVQNYKVQRSPCWMACDICNGCLLKLLEMFISRLRVHA